MKDNSKESNIIKEPQKVFIKIANIVFLLGILFSIFIIFYSLYKINFPSRSILYYYTSLLLGLFLAMLFGLGSRLNDSLKVNLSLLIIVVAISIYSIESYLELSIFFEKIQPKIIIEEQMGIPIFRNGREILLENLNKADIEAYPNVFPSYFIHTNGLKTKSGKIYPLGGISNIKYVFDNEGGFYPIIEADEHGFNNPKLLYENSGLDFVLTGDSFTEGKSVTSDKTISAVLRQSGYNTLNLGKRGNGALIELAAIKEYAEPLKPKVVLWLYCYNDIYNLKDEMNSSTLRKYLYNDDFSQNLISRQDEIDKELKIFIRNAFDLNYFPIRILKLTNLRERIKNISSKPDSDSKYDQELIVFKKILEKSRNLVSNWGGRLYFVYLVDWTRYSTGNEHEFHDYVLRIVSELDIPIIDTANDVFDLHPDPLALFPFRLKRHYNSEGYRLVAKAIVDRIEADKIIPLKSNN